MFDGGVSDALISRPNSLFKNISPFAPEPCQVKCVNYKFDALHFQFGNPLIEKRSAHGSAHIFQIYNVGLSWQK
jgi:hypothetical protein